MAELKVDSSIFIQTMKNFDISLPMDKCEQAVVYAPDVLPRSAVSRLGAWMHHNSELMAAFAATHYRECQKMLTALVAKIYDCLGEP